MTEAGFGADLGAEKFFDIKCRKAGLHPDAAVIVATVRALKMQRRRRAAPTSAPRTSRRCASGCANLGRHIANVRGFGVPAVVAINHFHGDTEAEIAAVRGLRRRHGTEAIVCRHWAEGSAGRSLDLARRVAALADSGAAQFDVLYPDEMPLLAQDRDDRPAHLPRRRGAGRHRASASSSTAWEQAGYGHLPICMAKTQYSFSTDPDRAARRPASACRCARCGSRPGRASSW